MIYMFVFQMMANWVIFIHKYNKFETTIIKNKYFYLINHFIELMQKKIKRDGHIFFFPNCFLLYKMEDGETYQIDLLC